MFCLNTSRNLYCQKFEFSLKVKVIESRLYSLAFSTLTDWPTDWVKGTWARIVNPLCIVASIWSIYRYHNAVVISAFWTIVCMPMGTRVIYICSIRLQLTVGSRDLSQAVKKMTVIWPFAKLSKFTKWQPFSSFENRCHFVNLLIFANMSKNSIFLSDWDKSHDPTVNWNILEQM